MIERHDIPLIAYVIYYAILVALAYPPAWWFVFCVQHAITHFRRAFTKQERTGP